MRQDIEPGAEYGGPAAGLQGPPARRLPLPLLVTGVAGVAGYNAFRYFRDRCPAGSVVGTRRADNWPLRGAAITAWDAHDRDGLERLFQKHRFAAVVHAEGSCALKSCELDPAMAYRANVQGTANLLRVIRNRPVRLVHLSVDLVFAGRDGGHYGEHDRPDPVTVYGQTMVQAEQLVFESCPAACVLRISLPMGVSFNGHAGAIDWIQSRFRQGKPATLYYDEVRTPTYTDCLNGTLEAVLASDLRGLYHAGGPRRLTLYQIAQIVNRVGGYDPRLLNGCLRHEAGPLPPRAGDVSMDSQRLARALGGRPLKPWPLLDEHRPTHAEWHFDEPRGARQLLARVLYRRPPRAPAAEPWDARLLSDH